MFFSGVSVVASPERLRVSDCGRCGLRTEYWRSTSEVRRFCSGREGGVSSDDAVDEGAGPRFSGVNQKM